MKGSWLSNRVVLGSPVLEGNNTFKQRVAGIGRVGLFLREQVFKATYSIPIDQVPGSILTIPLMATLVPVAWVAGAKLYVPELDRSYWEALVNLKAVVARHFPGLPLDGEVVAGSLIDNTMVGSETSKIGMLYSGGVDSTTTLIRHCEEQPEMITVHGSDVRLSSTEGWEKVKNLASSTGQELGLINAFIAANFRGMIDAKSLDLYFRPYTLGWWEGIQSGMGILGLAAPITWAHNIGLLYIAAGGDAVRPFSSLSDVTQSVKWGSTRVEYEGAHLSRQEKVESVVGYIKDMSSNIKLRVCFETQNGDNCGECFKCGSLIIALLLEGIDPSRHFPNFCPEKLATIREKISSGQWEEIRHSLKAYQKAIPRKREAMVPYANFFFTWLEEIDLDTERPPVVPSTRLKFKALRKTYFHSPYYILRRRLKTSWRSAINTISLQRQNLI